MKKIRTIAGPVVVVLIFLGLFLSVKSKALPKDHIASEAAVFVKANESIIQIVGDVESVKYSFKNIFLKDDSSSLFLSVIGSQKKEIFKIKILQDGEELIFKKISRRVGFVGEEIVWPNSEAKRVDFLLPSNVYDFLWTFSFGIFNYSLALSSKKEGLLFRMFYPRVLTRISSCFVYKNALVATVLFVIISICCLFDAFTWLGVGI